MALASSSASLLLIAGMVSVRKPHLFGPEGSGFPDGAGLVLWVQLCLPHQQDVEILTPSIAEWDLICK